MSRQNVTMADVAELANVSKMTVSRALNNKSGVSAATRRRILEAVEDLGYTPGSAVQRQPESAKLIGLLIPDITTTYMGEVLRGISGAAERLNYGLMLCTQGKTASHERTNYYLSLLNNSLVQGVLMVVPRGYESIVKDLEAFDLPFVIIDHHSDTEDEPSVTATNRKGTLDAMRHLLALGHQRIGFITGRDDIACSHDRLQGYRDGLEEVGLVYDETLVRKGDFLQASGFQQGHSLLTMEQPPTAIIASNDEMAFGVMDSAKALGLTIGRDVSIIGFDDIAMAAQTYPPLTTVRQPLASMGETAVDMLVTLLQKRPLLNHRQELTTELIIRQSTGRAP